MNGNMNKHLIEKGFQQVLEGIGFENLDAETREEVISNTPSRMAKAWIEWLDGMNHTESFVDELLSKSFPETSIGILSYKDIEFHSFCEHHLAPMRGKINVAILPALDEEGRGIATHGLSKVPRVIKVYSQRLSLQERLARQIADALFNYIDPKPEGVYVVLHHVNHDCMTSRGAKAHADGTCQAEARGVFLDPSRRNEAYQMWSL